MNKNLTDTATIKTKYGPTRTISIKDSISVLSVIKYANLIDDISNYICNELGEVNAGWIPARSGSHKK